jgi:putative FmdB family regulatory protein
VPLYEYACKKCGKHVDKIEKVDGPYLKKCPSCGGAVERVTSAPAIQFKGSGWYITDYGRSSAKDQSGKDSGGKDSGGKDATGKDGRDAGGRAGAAASGKSDGQPDSRSAGSKSNEKAPPPSAERSGEKKKSSGKEK